jgi:hypothetical protein
MAAKVADRGRSVGIDFIGPRSRARGVASARVVSVQLSQTVSVEYDVTLAEGAGATEHARVRVQFPDEVRAMLETSTWSRGASIMEAIGRLGAAYVERLDAAGLLDRVGSARGRDATFHLPLADLRTELAARGAGL